MTDRGAASVEAAITIDAEPGHVFAFDVRYLGAPVAHWRYDITAEGNGCRVTEKTWDHRTRWMAKAEMLS